MARLALDDGIDQPAGLVVQEMAPLARHHAVEEGEDAIALSILRSVRKPGATFGTWSLGESPSSAATPVLSLLLATRDFSSQCCPDVASSSVRSRSGLAVFGSGRS